MSSAENISHVSQYRLMNRVTNRNVDDDTLTVELKQLTRKIFGRRQSKLKF